MKRKVVAIGIDGPNTGRLESWLRAGLLPNMEKIALRGATARYTHVKRFRNERCWDTFLSGREMAGSGATFLTGSYDFFNESLQREERYAPFYALGEDYRVCMFDLPATLSPHVNGIQLAGWGSELNASTPVSAPADLMAEILARYGADPKLVNAARVVDFKSRETERSYVLPSLYDHFAVSAFKEKLLLAIKQRTEICLDLLSRADWDLFLALYPEVHTANHMLWHLGEDHPLRVHTPQTGHAVLEIFQAIDHAIGRIVERLPADTNVVVYTVDHTDVNSMDVPSMALLPELLYRWNFPGSRALAAGDGTQPVPPLRTDYGRHWKHEVWALRTPVGETQLVAPDQQERLGDPLSWNPANWYKPLWPGMRAFALPSVSDGYIRLNVLGRESQGWVEADRYQATLDELGQLLQRATNPRTGRPLVKSLTQTRKSPWDAPEIPPDLIVCWDDSMPADTLDSPDVGRIGPLPYFRSGGHASHGTVIENMLVAQGPDIPPGTSTRTGHLEDLPASLLHLLGAQIPGHIKGENLFRPRHP